MKQKPTLVDSLALFTKKDLWEANLRKRDILLEQESALREKDNQIADLRKKVEFLENQLAEAGKKMPDKIDFAIENLIKIQNVIFAFDICSQCKKIIKDIFEYRIDILKEGGKHDQ